ncbi:MAG: cysteine desulfurase [Candidatus Buchananbacteria bacterium]|nr:cysteine desulfurase [Candidatus Buchananbacteria bacterium]
MSIKNIKKDFTIFAKHKNLVYLDSASTSQKPLVVIEAESEWYKNYHANINRGAYRLSEAATGLYEMTRSRVARFINAEAPNTVVFTKGATEGINLVAWAWARHNLQKGDVILLTEMEHHANIVPWQMLAQEHGLELRFWPITATGELAISDLASLFKGVKLLALTHASNVLGTVNPVEKIVKLASQQGIKVLVDSAQAAGHFKIDVKKINPDFLVFSAHKMFGPTGVGVLYIKPDRHSEFVPYQTGGDMVREVTKTKTTFEKIPTMLEAGTQALAQVFSFGKAIEYLQKINIEVVAKYNQELINHAWQELSKIKAVTIYGPKDRISLISFTVKDIHPHDLATLLDRHGIAVRAGHHCAMPLHQALGVNATVRISLQIYNDKKDIDLFIKALKEIILQWSTHIAKK